MSQDFPPSVGGVQTYSAELARHLAGMCDALHVVAPDGPGAAEFDQRLGVPVHRVACSSDRLAVQAIPTVARLVRRERLDTALHAQWMTAITSLIARRPAVPLRVFLAAHGRELLLQAPIRSRVVRELYRRVRVRTLAAADGVIAVSRFTARLVETLGVPPARVHRVPNGTDPERFVVTDPQSDRAQAFRARHGLAGRRVALALGRLVPHKGVDTAIHAISIVCREHPDVVLAVVGSGPDRARLEAVVREVGVGDHVRFLGRVAQEEIREAFCGCEVFVMLSRCRPPDVEGFGVVFLEASASGRPCVGARSGGIPDAVADGISGLLVPPDDPEAAASAIGRLLRDRSFARTLGAQGRRRVERGWTWRDTARGVHAVISRPGPSKHRGEHLRQRLSQRREG